MIYAVTLSGGTITADELEAKGAPPPPSVPADGVLYFVDIGVEFVGRENDGIECCEIVVPTPQAAEVIRRVMEANAVQIGATAELVESHGDDAVIDSVRQVVAMILAAPRQPTILEGVNQGVTKH